MDPHCHSHAACKRAAVNDAESICRKRGLRFTPLRRRVLELIWDNHEVSRAYDLLAALQREDPRAKPPTVYRTLDFLLEQGFIHRIESLNAFVGCDHPEKRHEFQLLICTGCGLVEELHLPALSEELYRSARQRGFEPDSQTMEVHGRCSRCRGA